MTEKLKSCPFCGGKAYIQRTMLSETNHTFVTSCGDCGANISGYCTDEKQAATAWNRRVDNDS